MALIAVSGMGDEHPEHPQMKPDLEADAETLKRRLYQAATCDDIAVLLEVEPAALIRILYWSNERSKYTTFELRKRSGGVRTITKPPKNLAVLQRKLNQVLQVAGIYRESCHGFRAGRSLVTHSRMHASKRLLLNVDIEDFFGSINFGRVRGAFMKWPFNLPAAAATVLSQIACHDNKLPQGAPSSPAIANLVASRLDRDMEALAKRSRCTYSRYADDITLSTWSTEFAPEIVRRDVDGSGSISLGSELLAVFATNGFNLNAAKTRVEARGSRQEVTGLTVNRVPNCKRQFIREIRAMLHAWEAYGFALAEEKYRERYAPPGAVKPSFERALAGKLSFLRMVRGTDAGVVRRLHAAYCALNPKVKSLPPVKPRGPAEVHRSAPQWEGVVRWAQERIAHVVVHYANGDQQGGTAFWLYDDVWGTAAHVLWHEIAKVSVADKLVEECAVHARESEGVDVALLRVPGSGRWDGRFKWSDGLPKIGDPICSLGYPTVPNRRVELNFLHGYVESLPTSYRETVRYIQMSYQTSGGLSGAPVLDLRGELAGVVIENGFGEYLVPSLSTDKPAGSPSGGPRESGAPRSPALGGAVIEGASSSGRVAPTRPFPQAVPAIWLRDLVNAPNWERVDARIRGPRRR